jgi:signal transduction histidine kinase
MAGDTIEECDRLLDMINTMLLISQTQAGTVKIVQAPVDLVPLLRQAVDLFLPLAEDRQIRLTVDLPHRCTLKGDERMLQRLVANLIDNAIKYTPAAGEVGVELACGQEGGGAPKLIVSDSGCGISPEDQPHIFNRFYRCDQSRATQGSGLGLSLAQAIARVHGAVITVASRPGQGSRFSVTFAGESS